MKDQTALGFRRRDLRDGHARLVFVGIATRRHHHRHRGFVAPDRRQRVQAPIHTCLHNVHQVARQERQNHLRLRVAQPAVELQHLWPLGRQHQPGIEDAHIRHPRRGHAIQRRLEDRGLHLGDQLRRRQRRRRKRAHAARVWPVVVVQQPFVVLRRGHDPRRLAVTKGQHRQLRPQQPFFQQDGVARLAKAPVQQDAADHRGGLGLGRGQDHALPRGQPARLDHGRVVQPAQIAHSLVKVVKDRGLTRGDAVGDHELLGKRLGTFQLRGGLRRPKDAQPRGLEAIHHPRHQRRFRSHQGQVNRLPLRQRDQTVQVADFHCDVGRLGQRARAAVARRDPQPVHLGRLAQLPGQRMFAPAAADQQNSHSFLLTGCARAARHCAPMSFHRPVYQARRHSPKPRQALRIHSACATIAGTMVFPRRWLSYVD